MANDERGKRIEPVEEIRLLRAAAFDHRLSRGDVGVMAAVLEHCDSDWSAFPGPARIAKRANLAVTNVKRSLRKLEQLGYLQVHRRGVRKRSEYIVSAPPAVPTRRASVPSLNLRKGHDSARERTQFGSRNQHDRPVTGYESITPTGRADVHQLGTLARHESTLKAPIESTGAARAVSDEEKKRQQEQLRDSLRSEYLGVLQTHPKHARMMWRTFPKQLQGLDPPPGEKAA